MPDRHGPRRCHYLRAFQGRGPRTPRSPSATPGAHGRLGDFNPAPIQHSPASRSTCCSLAGANPAWLELLLRPSTLSPRRHLPHLGRWASNIKRTTPSTRTAAASTGRRRRRRQVASSTWRQRASQAGAPAARLLPPALHALLAARSHGGRRAHPAHRRARTAHRTRACPRFAWSSLSLRAERLGRAPRRIRPVARAGTSPRDFEQWPAQC